MGLETPLALLGLLGVLIPLLLHRMRNRELPHVVLPTFALLTRAVKKTQHKRAFTDLVLLLLRIGIVALAALSLATPYVRSQLRFGDGRLTSVVLVIDDSLSMSRSDGSGALIEQARSRALEVARALPEGSELAVVLAGKPARVLVPLTRDLSAVQHTLERAALPAVRATDLGEAIELALRQQSRGLVTPRRLLVLSDFARHAALDPKLLPQKATALSFERVGAPPRKPNLFIAEAHASPDPTRPRETSIAVEVRASFAGDARPEDVEARVEVEIDGKVASGLPVTLERGAAKVVLHVPTPIAEDTREARVRVVADDDLPADNQTSIVLGHADALALLLVNGDPRPATRADELYYAARALALLGDTQLAMRVQTVDPLSFERTDLRSSDVVVLANVAAPSSALAARLLEFVRAGGGVIIAAGSRIEAARYNAQLSALLPSHIRGSARAENLRFALGARGDFLSDGLAGLREARSQERLLLEPAPSAEVLLAFEDGAPALLARSLGDGRSLLFASTLDADYGDLPLRPGYLALLAAMIREAAGPIATARTHYAPGERVSLPAPRPGSFVEVRAPDGNSTRIGSQAGATGTGFDATDALGMFEIRVGQSDAPGPAKLRATFIVEAPREESELSPAELPKLEAAGGQAAANDVSVHVPFSPWLWLVAFALVCAEGVLRARRRSALRLST